MNRHNHVAPIALLSLTSALAIAEAGAQEIEPRAYSNIPRDVSFLVAGYAFSDGGLVTDPALPLEDADLRTHRTALAYARAIEIGGQSGKIDVVLPYAWLSGAGQLGGEPVSRSVSGFGDPRLRVAINLFGAPALAVRDLGSYRQDVIVGASLQVSVPLGQYDDTRAINIGSNRWFVRPELGVSKALGRWTLELAAAATFYTDNDDFYGGQTREQDPIYSVQGGVIYGFKNGVWLALNGTYYTGGRTTVDGVEGDDLQENSLVGLTVALPVDRRNSVKVYASTGVATRIGTDADTIGIAWQYRWGGGL